MARRSRKGKKNGSSSKTPILIGIGAAALLGLVFGSGILKKEGKPHGNAVNANFRIADYRRDGSRFASSGNSYVFEGKVENIETLGNDRIVSISMANNPDERLPLLVPGHVKLKVNLTRGDVFLFETSCRTGRTEDGGQVKGVLIVKNAETK